MRAGLPAILFVTMTTSPLAMAQPAAPTTLLHLSASGSVQVTPDQLAAELVASSTSPSAATAQRQVNFLMAEAMKAARAVSGGTAAVDARATGYSVSPADERHLSWVAQQTLELRGLDGGALLDLAGRLQGDGLAVASLDWQLSPSLRRRAHDEAMTQALGQLQAQAASAAAVLGLHVDHLREVRLDDPEFQSRRPARMMAMARMDAASPPQATAAPEEVDADVSADVLLRP